MDLVRALVEDRTTRIDRFHENTVDKSYFEGHYYMPCRGSLKSTENEGLQNVVTMDYYVVTGGSAAWQR